MSCDCVMWLFLTVPWVSLRCVVVAFPDHTHSRFDRLDPDLLASQVLRGFLKETMSGFSRAIFEKYI